MLYFRCFVGALLLYAVSFAGAYASDDIRTFTIDLEEEFVSLSKKAEDPFKIAASIDIISSDDIRRSGATNIPEALRLVPGVEVARSDSNKWAVTTRGFNRLYDNKVLVLIDGREIYSSVFTGVNWDVTDLVLEDIQHIEVIRGPTSSVWGSNTLNGTINIVTKDARYTQGNYASVIYGNKERIASYRNGNTVGEDLFYRSYVKHSERDSSRSIDNIRTTPGDNAGDDWHLSKAGFRLDWDKTVYDKLTFQGDIHSAKIDQLIFVPSLTTGISDTEDAKGANLSFKWDKYLSNDSRIELHGYYDHTSRDSQLEVLKRDIVSIDFQHFLNTSPRNELTWGAGFRYAYDQSDATVINGISINSYEPNEQHNKLYSLFVQDKYAVIPDKLDITIGNKFEHNYYSGFHNQPSARAAWYVDNKNTLWTSVSKAVRVPSKLEENLTRLATNSGSFLIYQTGNDAFKSEELVSHEIGYRTKLIPSSTLDISAFYNRYDHIRTFESTTNPLVFKLFNKSSAEVQGVNVDFEYDVNRNWNIGLGYSYTDIDLYFDGDSTDTISKFDAGVTPLHQMQLRSKYNLSRDVELDAYVYYVDALDSVNIPSYIRTDIRIGWKPFGNDDLELSLVGQDLFSDYHRETTRSFNSTHNEVGREIYGRLQWKF